MSAQCEVQPITAVQALPLRSAVLRAQRPIEDAIFAGDNDPTTLHLGAFVDGRLIGVASLYQEPLPNAVAHRIAAADAEHAWRLRGMVVEPQMQGRGYGRQLLNDCLRYVAQRGAALLWCNARSGVVDFYQAAGFEIYGNEFLIPDVGPHYLMLRSITASQDAAPSNAAPSDAT